MDEHLYTFENWLAGTICPEPSLIKKDNLNNNHTFQWTNFPESELDKIREKQKEIFYQEANNISDKWIEEFENYYRVSKERIKYISKEQKRIEEILFELVPSNSETTLATRTNILFNSDELRDIQYYAERTYIKNEKQEFDFIHSSMCQFQDKERIHPAITAQAYYTLLSHITEKSMIDKSSKHKGIFQMEHGEELCIKLVNKIVKEKSKVSDYSFIYYKLAEENIIDISIVKHSMFINYINEIFPI